MAIIIPIDADVSGLHRKLNGVTSSLGGFGKMAAVAAGAAAFGGLVATVKIGVDEFMQAEKVTAQTNAVLKSTGGIANVTKKQIEDLGTQIMRKSGMDDEAVKSAENLLLTFTNVRNEAGKGNDVFSQATKITADLSVAFGKDLNGSAILVGKALNDPVKGLGALSRVGIQFSEDQKKVIKKLVESGDTMQAQKMILKELETQVGGSAAAYGNTLSGKLDIARETFRNLAADIVSVVMPAVANAASVLGKFVSELAGKKDLKAKVDFVFETAEQVASRFYQWWTQPSMKTVRSPTSGVHVEFTPPGNEQVTTFIGQIDRAVQGKLNVWSQKTGHNLVAGLFGGAANAVSEQQNSFNSMLLKLIDPNYIGKRGLDQGAQLISAFVSGAFKALRENTGFGDAILAWLRRSIAEAMSGGGSGSVFQSIKDLVTGGFGRATRRGVLDRPAFARILTDDMKAAIQSARNGLAGAASGLVGMLDQIIAARGTNPSADLAAQRDLEDRRLKIQEDQLKAALAATEDGSTEQAQAKLDLDQFYYDKNATIRQRQVEDEQKANRTAIEDLVTRFNTGLDDAQTFANKLDAIIGGEKGTSLGAAFSLGFTNALQSIKNAATDIFNIAGQGSPLGPDVSATGPVTMAAEAAYSDALTKWQDQRKKLSDRLKELRDKANDKDSPGGTNITAAEKTRIDNAKSALEDWVAKKPKRSDYGLALGGILTGPRYLAGEAGNEAVIPLGSPTAVQMMRKAFSGVVAQGGDTNYNISINAGVGTDPNELGRVVVQAIKTYERKNGPVFVGV